MTKKNTTTQSRKRPATTAPAGKASPTAAGPVEQVAEYVGASLAQLMNRKDALIQQVAEVDRRIAAARRAVTATVAKALPRLASGNAPAGVTAPATRRPVKGNGKRKRPLPPDEPLVTATEKMRTAEAKGRAAKRARSSPRSGNR